MDGSLVDPVDRLRAREGLAGRGEVRGVGSSGKGGAEGVRGVSEDDEADEFEMVCCFLVDLGCRVVARV